ncbi:MAG: hypothetical protein KJO42_06570, partial [Silicimonas sp.]|nr:hypothetical protein [Silicimonas sp.]
SEISAYYTIGFDALYGFQGELWKAGLIASSATITNWVSCQFDRTLPVKSAMGVGQVPSFRWLPMFRRLPPNRSRRKNQSGLDLRFCLFGRNPIV